MSDGRAMSIRLRMVLIRCDACRDVNLPTWPAWLHYLAVHHRCAFWVLNRPWGWTGDD